MNDRAQERLKLRKFGISTAIGLTILGCGALIGRGPLAWLGVPEPISTELTLGAAIAVASAALFMPTLNRPLQRALVAVARGVAFVTLGVFFYGVLTPVGVAARLAGYDPLRIRPASKRDSYWRRHHPRDKQSYFNQS